MGPLTLSTSASLSRPSCTAAFTVTQREGLGVLYVPDSVLLSILQASTQLHGKRVLLLFIYLFVFETRFHSEA